MFSRNFYSGIEFGRCMSVSGRIFGDIAAGIAKELFRDDGIMKTKCLGNCDGIYSGAFVGIARFLQCEMFVKINKRIVENFYRNF